VALAVRPPLVMAVVATAVFALFHGVAHGLELPDMSSPWAYAAGFVAATAALHAAGYAVVRFLPKAAAPLVRLAGAASAITGAWLLAG
jgi:urease accessory protein